MRLSRGAELERSQIKDYLRKRGAGSFRRLLDGKRAGADLSGLLEERTQLVLRRLQPGTLNPRQLAACTIDIEGEHRHRRTIRTRLPAPAPFS